MGRFHASSQEGSVSSVRVSKDRSDLIICEPTLYMINIFMWLDLEHRGEREEQEVILPLDLARIDEKPVLGH